MALIKNAHNFYPNVRTFRAEIKAWSREMIFFIAFFTIFTGFVLSAGMVYTFVWQGMENYCFWNPWIDTQTSQGYTEEKFESIQIGMTKDEVLKIIGAPMGTYSSNGDEVWGFTRDGAASHGDWAWMYRSINFNGDAVRFKTASIIYD